MEQCPQENEEALAIASAGDSTLAVFSYFQVLPND
jgi:hypothetical protein